MNKTFFLLYPEKKRVTAEKILGWYADAVSNGEIEGDLISPKFVSVWDAIAALEDVGHITVARGR